MKTLFTGQLHITYRVVCLDSHNLSSGGQEPLPTLTKGQQNKAIYKLSIRIYMYILSGYGSVQLCPRWFPCRSIWELVPSVAPPPLADPPTQTESHKTTPLSDL